MGRTRSGGKSVSKSSLARRVDAILKADPVTQELVDLLTSGESMMRLRGSRVAAQGQLDLGDVTSAVFDEGDLADVLGIGFEAAPPVGDLAMATHIRQLVTAVRETVRRNLLPVTDSVQSSAGFIEMREELDLHFRRWMQNAVRQRLS